MSINVVSDQTGVTHKLSRGVYNYFNTHPVPVVGFRTEFLRFIMRLARNSHSMSDRDYAALEEEILDDSMNIFHANKNRNRRNRRKR